MEFHYTYTEADLAETTSPPPPTDKAAPDRKKSFLNGFFGWLLFVGLSVMLFMLLQSEKGPGSGVSTAHDEPTHGFLLTLLPQLIPWFLVSAFMLYFGLRQPGVGVPFYKPEQPRPKFIRRVATPLSLLFVVAAVVLTVVWWRLPLTPDWKPARLQLLLVACIPCLAGFVFVGFVVIRAARRSSDALGHLEATLRLPQTTIASEQGLRIRNDYFDQLFHWRYFVSYVETANLFLLYTKDLTVHTLPKRGLANPDDVDRFRAFLTNFISQGTLLSQPAAFPVVSRTVEIR